MSVPQSVRPIQPIQPIIRPTQPTQSIQPIQLIIRPIQPIQRVQPVTVTNPVQPAQPTIRPIQPVQVLPAANPVQPVIRPVQPVIQRVQPITVANPVQPTPVRPIISAIQPTPAPQFAPTLAFLAGPAAIVTTPAIDRLRLVWAGTPEEYFELSGLKYPNGVPILESADSDTLSIIADMLTSTPFAKVKEFLSQVESPRDIVFNRPEYQKYHQREARELFFNSQKPVDTEGIAVCAKCGGNKVTFVQIQNRSGDEGFTIKFTCTNRGCGHKWNVS